jgi:hypothetical protein
MGALFSGDGRAKKTSVKSEQSRRQDQIRKYNSLDPVFDIFAHNFISNIYFTL